MRGEVRNELPGDCGIRTEMRRRMQIEDGRRSGEEVVGGG